MSIVGTNRIHAMGRPCDRYRAETRRSQRRRATGENSGTGPQTSISTLGITAKNSPPERRPNQRVPSTSRCSPMSTSR